MCLSIGCKLDAQLVTPPLLFYSQPSIQKFTSVSWMFVNLSAGTEPPLRLLEFLHHGNCKTSFFDEEYFTQFRHFFTERKYVKHKNRRNTFNISTSM